MFAIPGAITLRFVLDMYQNSSTKIHKNSWAAKCYAAYFAEIYRGGIESIPKGQYEAAEVLGYSKVQTFWKIIFPQMVKRVLPPVTNEVITLVKDTSLAFALAYTEMFTLAKQVAASTASIMPLFIAGLFYYIFNFLVAMVMEKLEKRMQYFD